MEQKNVALYVRRGEMDGKTKIFTIENQERKLKEMCKNLGYDIYKIYCDKWNNGGDFNRDGLTELLNDLEDKKFSQIICYSRQRLMGGLIHQEEFFNIIKDHNCNIETYLSHIKM